MSSVFLLAKFCLVNLNIQNILRPLELPIATYDLLIIDTCILLTNLLQNDP